MARSSDVVGGIFSTAGILLLLTKVFGHWLFGLQTKGHNGWFLVGAAVLTLIIGSYALGDPAALQKKSFRH